jgi:basic membrane lipoprotein Med (substrate-binding protein (PBP1-ABC) superfamily)
MKVSIFLLAALSLLSCVAGYGTNKLIIGWSFIVQPDGLSWTYSHELAKGKIMKAYPTSEHYWTYLPISPLNTCDAPCRAAFEAFVASQPFDIIICAGTGTSAFVDQVADRFNRTKFLQTTSVPPTIPQNVGLFFGNIEQGRYLSGYLAGLVSQNKKVGYMREVNAIYTTRQMNAFHLGVYASCPSCSVYELNAAFINNKENDRKATQQLLERSGADVMAFHTLFSESGRVACSMGVRPMGYGTDLGLFVPNALTSAVFNWFPAVAHFVDKVNTNSFIAESLMGDLRSGVVELAPIPDDVPQAIRDKVEALRKEILGGKNFYCGPLVASYGPDANGCITRSRFLTINTPLPGAIDLGNADLSQPFTVPLNPSCWNPPANCADTPAAEPAACCGCIKD